MGDAGRLTECNHHETQNLTWTKIMQRRHGNASLLEGLRGDGHAGKMVQGDTFAQNILFWGQVAMYSSVGDVLCGRCGLHGEASRGCHQLLLRRRMSGRLCCAPVEVDATAGGGDVSAGVRERAQSRWGRVAVR